MRRIGPRGRAALLCALLSGLIAAPAAPAAVPSTAVEKSGAEIRDFWTKARMRAAQPVEIQVAPEAPDGAAPERGRPSFVHPAGAGAGAAIRSGAATESERVPLPDLGNRDQIEEPESERYRAHGKAYFTAGGQAYVCSATAVKSRNRSLVWTAGHCVFDQGNRSEHTNRFVNNFMFKPGYENGSAPYGEWAAKRLATTGKWKRSGNLSYDLGAVVVRKTSGERLQDVVGARSIGFGQPRDQVVKAFGYPAETPFDGEYEYRCTGAPEAKDNPPGQGPKTMRIRCDMNAGSSGGGWIASGKLVSVTSYGYQSDPTRLYGPYMSKVAKKLYKRTRGGR